MAVNIRRMIENLKSRPGHTYITPEGKTLYALTKNAEGADILLALDAPEGQKLTSMTDEEINQFIINKLRS